MVETTLYILALVRGYTSIPAAERCVRRRAALRRIAGSSAAPAAPRSSRWSIRRRGRSTAEAAASASRSAGAALRSPDLFYAQIASASWTRAR